MRHVALDELCSIRSGGTPSRSNSEFYGGDIPWAKISDIEASDGVLIQTEETITRKGLAAIRGRTFQPGTLLFAIYGSIGKMAFAGRELATNQAILGIENSNPDILSERYLYRYLESRRDVLLSDGAGIAQKNLSAGYVRNLKIPLPPLEEQRRIAGILDQADTLRRLRSRALDKLNTLGQAIFHEMFGDALKGDFFEFGQAVEEFRYGTSNKSGDAGLPTLRIPNVIGGGIDTTEIKTVEVTDAELERLRLREGDMLFVRTNGNPDYVGRCAAFSFRDVADFGFGADWIFASYLIRARLSDRINPAFAKTYFASQIGRSSVRERCKTSAGQYNINTEGLASLPFPKVPRAEQNKFADALEAIEKNSAPMKRSFVKMSEKFASLQHSAFRGEL